MENNNIIIIWRLISWQQGSVVHQYERVDQCQSINILVVNSCIDMPES